MVQIKRFGRIQNLVEWKVGRIEKFDRIKKFGPIKKCDWTKKFGPIVKFDWMKLFDRIEN